MNAYILTYLDQNIHGWTSSYLFYYDEYGKNIDREVSRLCYQLGLDPLEVSKQMVKTALLRQSKHDHYVTVT